MLYEVIHHTHSPKEGPGVGLILSGVGSQRAARAWAEHLLREDGHIYTTNGCYHLDLARTGSVSVREMKTRKPVAFYSPADFDLVHIVPSVGELGWSP